MGSSRSTAARWCRSSAPFWADRTPGNPPLTQQIRTAVRVNNLLEVAEHPVGPHRSDHSGCCSSSTFGRSRASLSAEPFVARESGDGLVVRRSADCRHIPQQLQEMPLRHCVRVFVRQEFNVPCRPRSRRGR